MVGHGVGETWDVDGGEVVGLDFPIEFRPRRHRDSFVGGSEALENRHRLGSVSLLNGQLDVREDPVGVGVGDEQRAVLPAGSAAELVTVDKSHASFYRIDAKAGPGDVEERQRRQHVDGDTIVVAQQLPPFVPTPAANRERRRGSRRVRWR